MPLIDGGQVAAIMLVKHFVALPESCFGQTFAELHESKTVKFYRPVYCEPSESIFKVRALMSAGKCQMGVLIRDAKSMNF